ncbi:flippase [Porticoccaceae bacterium]|nr:flippase [Porticoccaceae bacterium]MDB2486552.1 flippase [Porticoccaceae bacterium]MDB2635406.1 flippase [Porticoccaceae bacterium]MDB2664156.1 flippase [Porticoccaceae bacterium]MDC0494533.1 flippase [bacterium]
MKVNLPLQSTAWLLVEKVVYLLISLAVTVALARYLQPSQFGNLNYLLALIALFTPLMTAGLNSIVSREVLLRPDDVDQILGSSLFLRFCAAVLVIATVVTASSYYLTGANKVFFAVLMMASIASSAQVVDFWLQAKLANRYSVILRLTMLVCFSLLRLFAIYYAADFATFVYLIAIELVITGLLYLVIYQRLSGGLLALRANRPEIKRLWKDSRWLLMSGIAAIVYLKVDQVMLGLMLDKYAVGVYAAAARVSEVWYFIPAAIVTSFFPKLVTVKQTDTKLYRVEIQRLNDILFTLAVAIAIVVSIIGDELVVWLFGSAYSDSAEIVLVHIWGAVFVFMRELFSKWLLAESFFTLSLLTQGLGAIANVGLNYFLIPIYGPLGAAYATVISYSVAGYLVLLIHPKLWSMARITSMSFLLPLRALKYGRRLYSTSHSL